MKGMSRKWPHPAAAALSLALTLVSAASSIAAATTLQFVEPNTPSTNAQKPDVARAGIAFPDAVEGGNDLPLEVEPNGNAATATPIAGSRARIKGTVYPAADVDFYSFTAAAGDRIYAATQTLFDASASGDTTLQVIGTDGTTVLEADNNDGTFNASSASIAGTLIPTGGTYYLRVAHNVATGTVRPYSLFFQNQSAAPTAEAEPNETPATATPLPASGHVSGTISAVSPGESDFYSLALNAGDTVFLSLDMNPERDASVWNGRLGFALFGNPPANQILVANDANAGGTPTDPNSEAFFFTVKDAGTYYVYVDSIVAAGLGANATYNLNVSVLPLPTPAGTCTTYTSTDVPQTIPTGPGSVSSTLTIPGNPRIADIDVAINLNHTFMQDLDVHLISPAGNDNGLFTDVGAATVGGPQTLMDVVLDDEAALPFAFAVTSAYRVQPELAYRLSWFDGEDAGGTWTLQIRDDATGDGGTLNSWSVRVCEPPPPPACPSGTIQTTVYTTDFEGGAAGFTHSGTQDEWELGLPAFNPITTCNSGTSCWKTDLDNSYNASSNQTLLSPSINLAGLQPPVLVRWAQRHHIESANFDGYSVTAQEVGGANPVNLFQWLDATMNDNIGNPTTTIAESAGWAQYVRQVDSLAGTNAELVFNLNSDTTVQLAGAAIDDVSVTACRAISADLSITKTDGVTTAVPGGSVTYTITASNAGPDPTTSATVADTFPAALTCTWTCVGAGGGTCTAAGSGNINDPVVLPAGGSV
ncbi:MAG: proprotein convertase P-domain-containing protein, partial [Xanthomonadales bacterium]|nr:proprotein convertase P-domain-containing protein [Xanthomonadales bacterium]